MENAIFINKNICIVSEENQEALYQVFLIEKGSGTLQIDLTTHAIHQNVLIFCTPYQKLHWQLTDTSYLIYQIKFHGDFYCIEYHKKEVACNGILFNNIYISQEVVINNKETAFFNNILNEMGTELLESKDNIVIKAYLQLFLAKASQLKKKQLSVSNVNVNDDMFLFQQKIEQNFLTLHKPSDYALLLNVSVNTLFKKTKKAFNKTPTRLIQDRMVLEAKKKLHLTRLSIKEIAYYLNFEDANYFSRFFKNNVGVSPQLYREKTGISIVADL